MAVVTFFHPLFRHLLCSFFLAFFLFPFVLPSLVSQQPVLLHVAACWEDVGGQYRLRRVASGRKTCFCVFFPFISSDLHLYTYIHTHTYTYSLSLYPPLFDTSLRSRHSYPKPPGHSQLTDCRHSGSGRHVAFLPPAPASLGQATGLLLKKSHKSGHQTSNYVHPL